jgi:hypothetical protein
LPAPSKPTGIRKKRPIQHGRRTIRIAVSDHTSFTLLEDLLCSKSNFFAKALQPKRKPIQEVSNYEDNDCPICQFPLEQGVKELDIDALPKEFV